MRSETIKITLYIFFIVLLLLPIVQYVVPFKEVMPLKGAVIVSEKPILTKKSWFQNQFQTDFEKFINDNIGFRPWLVKLHNQFQFTFYGKANARGVIRGKEGYLYEMNYIKAFNGEDFIGGSIIENKVKDIKQLQDTLSKLGKTLLVCIAPGKGSFYPEFFPDEYTKSPSDSTNYKQYSRYMGLHEVNHIDMNEWFINLKDTCSCMLYPKYGIHWSHYGMLIAADSIISYIEADRKIQMPHINFPEIKRTSRLRYTDYDIAAGMNLLFQMPSEPMCYPSYSWDSDMQLVKPKTIIISDSFYWSMFNIGMSTSTFSLGGFWYYNSQILPDSYDKLLLVNQVDMKQEILENDVVILISTEANLSKFSWGFIEDANKVFGVN